MIYLIHTLYREKMQESMKRIYGERMIHQLQDKRPMSMVTSSSMMLISFIHLDKKFQFSIGFLSLLVLGKQLLSLVLVVVVSILRRNGYIPVVD